MSPTASSTYDGQQHFWCVRYRTAAAAVELYYVGVEMHSYISYFDGTFLRSCTVGHRVFPEIGVSDTAL